MPLAVLRADASAAIGGGHVMRCIALARALRAAGWQTRLACTPGTLEIVPEAAREAPLPLPPDGREATRLAAVLEAPCALLLVDHYGWDASDYRAARPLAAGLAAIVDAPGQAQAVDLLIDPTPGRVAAAHGRNASRVLAGTAFAPLRPAIRASRRTALALAVPAGPARRVLVAMGMTDPTDATSAVVAALADLPTQVAVNIVLGGSAPNRARIAESLPAWARLHVDPPDIAALVLEADLAIGAGGVGALERACLGVPQLLVEVATNQRDAIAGLSAAGAALPVTLSHLAARLPGYLADAAGLAAMRTRAFVACDGLGAPRASMHLAPGVDRLGRAVTLRPVAADDSDRLLAWQHMPGMRAFARDPIPPTAQSHARWFAGRLAEPEGPFSIIEVADEPAGVLRLDLLAGAGERYEVTIMIAPHFQGTGVGRAALAQARRLVPDAVLFAAVLAGNAASDSMFRAAGYCPAPGGFESLPVRAA
jgi:UDP-2,4-diacetamido-2,4,6-trideoxy-beta-L-altropyranose hydrolase